MQLVVTILLSNVPPDLSQALCTAVQGVSGHVHGLRDKRVTTESSNFFPNPEVSNQKRTKENKLLVIFDKAAAQPHRSPATLNVFASFHTGEPKATPVWYRH